MVSNMFSRTVQHEHAEPAQRVLGAAQLAGDSPELARLLAADPAPEVRIAAAQRCNNPATLAAAWQKEPDLPVRAALVAALDHALSRVEDADSRRSAIAGMQDEDLLVALALGAALAETRKAAAERVQTPAALRRLADAAKNKDRGVAKFAQQRIDEFTRQTNQSAEADAILTQLEELATKSGPILSAVVDLDRHWQRLDMSGDAARRARHDAARAAVQARFAREQDEQRMRAKFEKRLRELAVAAATPATPEVLAGQRAELAELRAEAQARNDGAALAELDRTDGRIAQIEQELASLAAAEALVVEAEQLAAGTTVDNAQLPARWQALARAIRTPALTQRFETALIMVEQRRLALIHASEQQAGAVRQQVHGLLHTAEQALAAGQLQAARAAADNIKRLKAGAGLLPKPTTQRLGRLVQQLVELERWESYGQRNARLQLCERAEALAAQTLDARELALEVQKVRDEWKVLDKQHPGVPKALWQRFDGACEKAYAPAARHFAEVAAQRKEARRQRDEFIALAAQHAPTLLTEPRDWRAIERWLRDTEQSWREGNLGSVEPRSWKKFDKEFKAALQPLRDALAAERDQAQAQRRALIAEATALAARALERDTLSQVKALQARWQEQAKAVTLLQRDERALWEQFRAACNAVFAARDSQRKEVDEKKNAGRYAREAVCAQLEQLAMSTDQDDQGVRQSMRDLQQQWKKLPGAADPALRGVEARFKKAQVAVEAALSSRARSREAAVWQTLAAKEQLCEELDRLARARPDTDEAAAQLAAALARWNALPPLPAAWEKPMTARRDAALGALSDASGAPAHAANMERAASARREGLIELELLLGLDSPPALQAQRLALQVKQLRERFKNAATTGALTAGERLLAWCAAAGIADADDRQRCARIFAKVAQP